MPPRHIILVILAFWVATTGWLFYRDLWPRLLPDAPPPFTIDLADEVSEQKIYWKLLQNGQDKSSYAFSWVHYRPADDIFEVSGEFKLFSHGKDSAHTNADQVVESTYGVTRDGELRYVYVEVSMKIHNIIVPQDVIVQARITGRVEGQLFRPHLHLASFTVPANQKGGDIPVTAPSDHDRAGPAIEMDLKPVAVSRRGSILNPLQPLNRLQGLRPGQRWRVPMIDPLQDAFRAFSGQPAEVNLLEAEVLPQLQMLTWGTRHREREDACLVIDYQGENCRARTWVRANDGLVLRQEFTQHGETLALQRD